MQIFNAAPPADFPAQVIVAHDAKFAASHPNDVYWLRVTPSNTAAHDASWCNEKASAVLASEEKR